MNTDDDMRTPFLKSILTESYAAALEELARLRTKTIDRPVEILHPTLLISEHPIVNTDQFVSDVMRLFDCFNNSNRDRLPLPKSLQPFRKRLRSRAMSAAGIGRD